MDLAYVFSAIRYFVGGDGRYEVTKTDPVLYPGDKRVDLAMFAELAFHLNGENAAPIRCKVVADLRPPRILGMIPSLKRPNAVMEFENATVTLTRYLLLNPLYLNRPVADR